MTGTIIMNITRRLEESVTKKSIFLSAISCSWLISDSTLHRYCSLDIENDFWNHSRQKLCRIEGNEGNQDSIQTKNYIISFNIPNHNNSIKAYYEMANYSWWVSECWCVIIAVVVLEAEIIFLNWRYRIFFVKRSRNLVNMSLLGILAYFLQMILLKQLVPKEYLFKS